MLASRSLPPMRDSLVTVNKRPAATPDSSTRMRSAAISVKPCELCFPCPIFVLLPPRNITTKTSLIPVAECHVARTDRSRQIHVLRLIAVVKNALSHDHDVDLLNQVRRFTDANRIGLIRIERSGG